MSPLMITLYNVAALQALCFSISELRLQEMTRARPTVNSTSSQKLINVYSRPKKLGRSLGPFNASTLVQPGEQIDSTDWAVAKTKNKAQ